MMCQQNTIIGNQQYQIAKLSKELADLSQAVYQLQNIMALKVQKDQVLLSMVEDMEKNIL